MSASDDDDDVEYEPEIFDIGGHNFEILTISFLPITKLMSLQESSTEISGQKLWCGSVSVMEYLLDNSELIVDRVVIELGAGTGVLGMLCKILGSRIVYLTDHDNKSLEHMQADVLRNHIEANIVKLDWFTPDLSFLAQLNATGIRKQLTIVAGDVLYKKSLIPPFLTLVKKLFATHEGASLLLCHVPRAGVEHAHVLAACRETGLRVDIIPPEHWRKGACYVYCPLEDVERAELYHVRASI